MKEDDVMKALEPLRSDSSGAPGGSSGLEEKVWDRIEEGRARRTKWMRRWIASGVLVVIAAGAAFGSGATRPDGWIHDLIQMIHAHMREFHRSFEPPHGAPPETPR